MKVETVKEMMDACYKAKRIHDMLPKLPEGVAPSYMRFFDIISKGDTTISTISDALNIPRPGVTRTLKSMETKGYIQKVTSKEDARYTYIVLTQTGEALYEQYNKQYFQSLALNLDISENEVNQMIETINKLYDFMKERDSNG